MSKLNTWVEAARPKTLAASVVPVIVGASLAFADSSFHRAASVAALFCALAIQIGTNFANDYFDFIKGADTHERIGFQRATASGLISPKAMLWAAVITMAVAFLAGIYLIRIGGWPVFWIGTTSILFGILYTGGPYPIGYNGLGDLFVFIFFGIVAVMGTYYVNVLVWSAESFTAALAVGALCVNILVVNNLRDIDQDRVAGKKTLGVLFGERALKLEYLLMVVVSFAVLPWLYVGFDYNAWVFIPVLSLPFALLLTYRVWTHAEKRLLNRTLENTAKLMLLFGLLFSIGILFQTN